MIRRTDQEIRDAAIAIEREKDEAMITRAVTNALSAFFLRRRRNARPPRPRSK